MAAEQPITKFCRGCNRILPLSAFGKAKWTKSGVTARCRECNAAARRKWVKENPEKSKAILARWEKNNHARRLEVSRAHHAKYRERDNAAKNAARAADPEKARQRERELWKKNKDKIAKARAARGQWHKDNNTEIWLRRQEKSKAHNKAYYEQDKAGFIAKYIRAYRARKRGAEGRYTQEDIEKLLKAQRCKCAYCHTSLRNGFHVDHIVALSNGGSNWPANLQLLCESCNLSKGAKDPIEFAQRLGRLL
jgi:5-methylcytosine-specific restriction endonuclease McrA